jgi:hypothetical protein
MEVSIMGMQIRYVGPKDHKTYQGQRFPRLVAVEVPNVLATVLLSDPNSFLPAAQEIPEEVLAQRDALPAAMEREGRDRIEAYRRKVYEAEMLPQGSIDENTGKPDAAMRRRQDSIAGAQDEVAAGEKLIEQAKILRQRIQSEKAIAAAPADEPLIIDVEGVDVEPKTRRRKSEVAV